MTRFLIRQAGRLAGEPINLAVGDSLRVSLPTLGGEEVVLISMAVPDAIEIHFNPPDAFPDDMPRWGWSSDE